MIKNLLIVASLIFLWSCSTGGVGNAYTETAAVCENPGLETQVKSYQDTSRRLAGALGIGVQQGGGAVGVASDKTNVTRAYEVRDKLLFYEAEIEAMARNITSSCKNHSRCMEANRYREGKCRSALARWDSAEERFVAMTREFREIEAETDRLLAALSRPVGGKKRPRRHHSLNRCECGSNIGPFANCCDKDSDQQYERRKSY